MEQKALLGGDGRSEEYSYGRKVLAEAFGAMMLVGIGCGSLASNGPGTVTIIPQWVFGAVVFALIMAAGPVSGAHFNPQVTIPAVLLGTLTVAEGAGYICAQMAGGVVGAAFNWLVIPPPSGPGSLGASAGCGRLAPGLKEWQAMLVETAGTALLVTAVLVGDMHRPQTVASPIAGPLGVMCALVAAIGFAGPLTSAGLNYARIFGPSLVFNCWDSHWIWPVGEVLGSLFGLAFAVAIVPRLWRRLLRIEGAPLPLVQ